jgi:hypothetical protein
VCALVSRHRDAPYLPFHANRRPSSVNAALRSSSARLALPKLGVHLTRELVVVLIEKLLIRPDPGDDSAIMAESEFNFANVWQVKSCSSPGPNFLPSRRDGK